MVFVASVALATNGLSVPNDRQLPFMAGETWWCSQDWYINADPYTHLNEAAWDFNMDVSDLGAPLLAPSDGIIEYAGNTGGAYGIVVLIAYPDGSYERLAHCSDVAVKKGEVVQQGQVVAWCGGTPSWPVHLHINAQSSSSPTASGSNSIECYFHYKQGTTTYFAKPVGCTCTSGAGPEYHYTSLNSNIIDLRKETTLNDRNPYGWPETPDEVFGDQASPPGALYEIGWYHAYNPNSLYNGDGTSKNCYRAIYDGGNDEAVIVYDALGGARHAYVVGWEKWSIWDNLGVSCGSCPQPAGSDGPSGQGGPNSCLGMPLTNSYQISANPEIWRQDFQKGLIYNGEIHCYVHCAPGWTSSGWNRQYSYLFADAYDRNGARRDVGNACGSIQTLSGNILIQKFVGGNDTPGADTGWVMYDLLNSDGNPCATNEAYWVYGDIKYYYDHASDGQGSGVNRFGCATTDCFQDGEDRLCQDFKSGNQSWRVFADGGYPLALNPCDPSVQAAGGGMGGGENDWCDLASVYDYTSYARIHSWLSNSDGFVYQGDGGWWSSVEYPGDSVVHVMSGDFDGDLFDDVAVVQNKIISGTPKARVQVWLSTGGSFSFEDAWWAASGGYNALNVVHAESGDFNGDGKCDVALVYDYGYVVDKYQTRVHVLISTGSSFSLQSWWTSSGSYNAQNIRHCVAGDYTGDGKCDLVFFYDYGLVNGQYQFRSHVLVSDGGDFALQSWYTNTNYNIDDVTQAVGGDFNDDGECDVAFAHADAPSTTSLHVLQSTGSAFTFANWWTSGGSYGATNVKQAAAGDFDGDGKDDVMLAYAYSTVWVRFHMFLSTGSAFDLDHGSEGWWEAGAYGITNHVRGIVAGNFNPPLTAAGKRSTDQDKEGLPLSFSLFQNYPNPFNPVTNISYSLPNPTHVTLEVFNILGQRVALLVNHDLPAGNHTTVWQAEKQASGIYFYRLRTEDAVETKKMLLLK